MQFSFNFQVNLANIANPLMNFQCIWAFTQYSRPFDGFQLRTFSREHERASLTLSGEPTSTGGYIFIDRLFVLSSTLAALSMVLPENLTYVYWIRYRTTHCGYALVPSELHLPQVCVFKPMNLHSTYGEECWAYSIPSDLARPRAVRFTIRSSAQNSKLHFLQNLIRSQHWASALHRNLKRLVLSGIL